MLAADSSEVARVVGEGTGRGLQRSHGAAKRCLSVQLVVDIAAVCQCVAKGLTWHTAPSSMSVDVMPTRMPCVDPPSGRLAFPASTHATIVSFLCLSGHLLLAAKQDLLLTLLNYFSGTRRPKAPRDSQQGPPLPENDCSHNSAASSYCTKKLASPFQHPECLPCS